VRCKELRKEVRRRTFNHLILLAVLGLPTIRASAGPLITGSYKVVGATDFGSDVRVKLLVVFSNPGEERLFITRFTVRELVSHRRSDEVPGTVLLEPHTTTEATQEFTIPKSEYEIWQAGVRPRLLLKLQNSKGEETDITIALAHRPG
jgi:hypothetical protein